MPVFLGALALLDSFFAVWDCSRGGRTQEEGEHSGMQQLCSDAIKGVCNVPVQFFCLSQA